MRAMPLLHFEGCPRLPRPRLLIAYIYRAFNSAQNSSMIDSSCQHAEPPTPPHPIPPHPTPSHPWKASGGALEGFGEGLENLPKS